MAAYATSLDLTQVEPNGKESEYVTMDYPTNQVVTTTLQQKQHPPTKKKAKLTKMQIIVLITVLISVVLSIIAITLAIQSRLGSDDSQQTKKIVYLEKGLADTKNGLQEANKLANEREIRLNAILEEKLSQWRFEIANLEEIPIWYHASNGYFYKVFENRVSYEEAKASCQEKGARLVTEGVRNVEMRAETKRLMKMKGQEVWIGLNDLVTEGKWTWEDGVDGPIEWGPEEPNNGGTVSANEDCGHYHSLADWTVNDIPCDRKFMYMCEKTN